MKVVVGGGSGFIGEPLVRTFLTRGHDVAVLSRNPSKVKAGRGLQWDAQSQGPWSADVANADVVINLTGENIGEGRWTEARKRRLIDSRVHSTRAIVEAMRTAPTRSRVFLNASAVGFYGARGDEPLDENAPRGEGFLADLVARWEEEARAAEGIARVITPRFGVVLAADGGALPKMILPFRFGAGGPVGRGDQWLSWIDRDDLMRLIEWMISRDSARGVYNATAPEPVRNRDFAVAAGKVLRRPSFLPAPAFALKLAFGQMADEMLLAGQRVVPARALREGFTFAYPDIESSLRHVLA
jgi:uncharacterized protein (TIGR01777 family)